MGGGVEASALPPPSYLCSLQSLAGSPWAAQVCLFGPVALACTCSASTSCLSSSAALTTSCFVFTGPGGGLHTSPQYSEKDWLLGVAFVQPADPGKQLGTGKKEPCLDLDLVLGWGPLQETLRRCWGARHKLECTQESPGDLVQMQILAGFWGGAEESLMGSLLVSKPQVSCAHPSSLQPGFCPLFTLALHHQTC